MKRKKNKTPKQNKSKKKSEMLRSVFDYQKQSVINYLRRKFSKTTTVTHSAWHCCTVYKLVKYQFNILKDKIYTREKKDNSNKMYLKFKSDKNEQK